MFARISKLGMLLAFTTLTVAACDDDATGITPPTVQDVAGEYAAGEDMGSFSSTVDAETTDLLGAGATLTLVLEADGTTSGSIFVPGWGEDEADLEADLDGAWVLTDFVVTLDIVADSFLDGLTLTWTDGMLAATGTLEGEDTTFDLQLEGS
jgi:hypothetical protein